MEYQHLNFLDVVLDTMQASLHDGLVYLFVYPNFVVSLFFLAFTLLDREPLDY